MIVSPGETTVIRGPLNSPENLSGLLKLIGPDRLAVLILEGFRSMLSDEKDVAKIIVASNESDLQEILKDVAPPIIAISGPVARGIGRLPNSDAPIVDLETQGEMLVELARNYVLWKCRVKES